MSALTSPTTLSGVRLLSARMRRIGSSRPSAVAIRTGGSCNPSAKMSVASDAIPPADPPPMSETWISVPVKYSTWPSTKIGLNTRMSLVWTPPL